LAEAETVLRASGIPAGAPSRHEADANLSTARAFSARLEGRDDPVLWDAAAQGWERAGEPYQIARARWHQAEAALPGGKDARVARATARGPLLEAARIARELGARPLLRELTNLASRALITIPGLAADAAGAGRASIPTAVGPGLSGAPDSAIGHGLDFPRSRGAEAAAAAHGPSSQGEPIASRESGDAPDSRGIAAAFAPQDGTKKKEAFGLSRREVEVLALIAEGRTNREIGERLFISQKTVGVHVGNILSKLGASGRVEAAMVAIRLELVPTPMAARPVLAAG
jgi:DNA-binding CsgD family transcriptional regulator